MDSCYSTDPDRVLFDHSQWMSLHNCQRSLPALGSRKLSEIPSSWLCKRRSTVSLAVPGRSSMDRETPPEAIHPALSCWVSRKQSHTRSWPQFDGTRRTIISAIPWLEIWATVSFGDRDLLGLLDDLSESPESQWNKFHVNVPRKQSVHTSNWKLDIHHVPHT